LKQRNRGPCRIIRAKDYFNHLVDQAKAMRAKGLDSFQAARELDLGRFSDWAESERVAVNMDTIYRELEGQAEKTNVLELFGRMARWPGTNRICGRARAPAQI
jgi:hypothetical protein